MARRTRRSKTTAAASWHKDPDDAVIEEPAREVQALIEAVSEGIPKELIFSPAGPTQMSGLLMAGGYKTTPVNGDTEMTFRGIRMGKRGKVIFEFEPVEPGDYKQFELDETKVFTAFPDLEDKAKRSLHPTDAQMAAHSFSEIAQMFMSNSKKMFMEAERLKKVKEETAERSRYEDDPNWGLF